MNKQLINICAITLLSSILFTGCGSQSLSKEEQGIAEQREPLDTVEQSATKEPEKKTDKETDESIVDFDSVDSQESYCALIEKLEKQNCVGQGDENFDVELKKFQELYNGSSNFEAIKDLKSFKDAFWISHGTRMYHIDINNDGQKEYVFASTNQGTGNFAYLERIFAIENNELKEIEEPEDFSIKNLAANGLDIYSYNGKQYIRFLSFKTYEYYLWEGEKVTLVFDEASLVDNKHLDQEDSSEIDRIKKAYGIEERLAVLKEKEIDYTVSGYTNEEIITSFYRIKDYVQNDDKDNLSKMILYPISYTDDAGESHDIYTKEEFVAQYDEIMTEAFKEMIASENDEEIFANWRGCMLGSGEVWFTKAIIAFRP